MVIFQTCVRFDTGKVKCFGLNSDGQLGLNDMEDRGDETNEMGLLLPFVDFGDILNKNTDTQIEVIIGAGVGAAVACLFAYLLLYYRPKKTEATCSDSTSKESRVRLLFDTQLGEGRSESC